MKILLTHERFPPDFAGGGEHVVYRIARHLQEAGHEIRVLAGGDPAVTEYEGIRTRRIPVSKYRFNLAVGTVIEEARGCDIIQTFNYHACLPSFLAGRRLGIPVVCEILGLFGRTWLEMRGPWLGRGWMAWERFLLSRPYARTLFLSDFSRDAGLAAGADPVTSRVLPPGIDPRFFGNRAEKEDFVLFVGKLEVRKGVRDVVEVAKRLPHIPFRILGWGDRVESLLADAPPNLDITVQQPQMEQEDNLRQLMEAFAAARIFFFPSRAETFGLVIAEAMASGCAVVSSVPLPFAGVHLDSYDPESMAKVLSDLWRDRATGTAMGEENRRLAAAYSWERHIDGLLNIYREVLEERTDRPRGS